MPEEYTHTHTHTHTYICVYIYENVCIHVCMCVHMYTYIKASQGLSGKESACQCRSHRRLGLITGSGRFPWGRHGNPLQYSCPTNSMDRGVWQATVHGGHKESDMTEQHPQGCTPQNLLHCVRCTVHSKQQAFSVTHINTHVFSLCKQWCQVTADPFKLLIVMRCY